MNSKSIIRDLEKQRAEFAYDKVEEFLERNKELQEFQKELKNNKIDCKENKENEICKKVKELENYKSPKEYKSYVKKIPSLIQTNGLSATFAFMYSKKGTYEIIYKQVEKWLKEERKIKKNEEELVRWMINLPSPEYRRVTNEVMGLFVWLRRFAEGMVKDENGKEEKK
ncbi:MAG: type III-B CRISPR module-associated protein Cmr5 [Nautiliaceae bacterium]